MESVIYDNMYYDDSSDSSSSDFTSSDFVTGTYVLGLPAYNIGPYIPTQLIEPVVPVNQTNPIVPDLINPQLEYFDLEDVFEHYNKSMATLTDNIIKVSVIYAKYMDGDKVYENFDPVHKVALDLTVPIKKFVPLIYDSYIFPASEEIVEMVDTMNSNIRLYDDEYKKMLGYHDKYFAQFEKDYEKLKNTALN